MTNSSPVLIIDDDPILVETLKAYFSSRGVTEFAVASDGASAIKVFDQIGPSIRLITCDLNMPDCDGIEFLGLLKNRNCVAPIVVITSAMEFVSKSAEVLARASGLKFLGVIQKPVSMQVLNETFVSVDFS